MVIRVLAVAAGAVFATAALANMGINTSFKEIAKAPKGSALERAGCNACHAGMPKLNAFGVDVQKAMKAASAKKLSPEIAAKVADLDSDKDGVKNGDEVKKGTLPGDPRSK